VVALLANLAPQADLAHSEVEMLFHEFGHAMHSLLSRTHFQHLAGAALWLYGGRGSLAGEMGRWGFGGGRGRGVDVGATCLADT
jgi:hypothetical protein